MPTFHLTFDLTEAQTRQVENKTGDGRAHEAAKQYAQAAVNDALERDGFLVEPDAPVSIESSAPTPTRAKQSKKSKKR